MRNHADTPTIRFQKGKVVVHGGGAFPAAQRATSVYCTTSVFSRAKAASQ